MLARGWAFGTQRWPQWVEDPPAKARWGRQRGGEGWGCLPGAAGGRWVQHPNPPSEQVAGKDQERVIDAKHATALARKWPKNGTAQQFPVLHACVRVHVCTSAVPTGWESRWCGCCCGAWWIRTRPGTGVGDFSTAAKSNVQCKCVLNGCCDAE